MKYTVISFFDGISCGRIALERAGIEFDNYYAFEVDKHAIKISQANYPDIIQCGSVTDCSYCDGFLFTRNGWFEIGKNVLFIGGSPCQGFSFAGKQLNFDDPRSKLFFEYVKMLRSLQHDRNVKFLLENVKMKKEYEDVISEKLGVSPVKINSALVSAQNRQRLYWCNWPVSQPEDQHIYLKDIIEYGSVDCNKSFCIDANYFKGGSLKQYFEKSRRQLVFDSCNLIGHADEIKGKDQWRRVYDINGKAPTLTAICGGHQEPKIAIDDIKWRKLTPIECERLQTVPDNYTNYVANSHRYHALGNGWTVDVIVHIFKEMMKNQK